MSQKLGSEIAMVGKHDYRDTEAIAEAVHQTRISAP